MKPFLFLPFILFSIFSFAQQKPWIDFTKNGKIDVYENLELNKLKQL